MPRTLITGATGFIGCRLAERWHGNGREVAATGMVRNEVEDERATGLRKAGVPLLEADLSSPEKIDEACQGVDTIVHLAAAQHEANVSDGYFMRVNVEATREFVKRAAQQGVRRFFYASSIGVYGIAGDSMIDEDTPLAPDNAYGRSKVAAEEMLAKENGGLQVFIGRIGETYGPWDRRLLKLYSGIRKGRFLMVGRGGNLHQPVHVDDLALAIDRLLETPAAAGRPVILSGDDAITTRQMCESIAAAVGKNLSRWNIPMTPMMLAAGAMEATLGRAGIQPPLHRRRLDFFRKSLKFSTARRDALLDLPPQRSFDDGAKETATWYRDHNWLPLEPAIAGDR
ncbi:MAG TPA: NAD-dependent epimerase/dehydratase family protein [Woeseiaceae bacterium]|nr:NAD-dependent epimerase/dehydratase family protein [Woeseiaceae bacterium]